MESTVNYGYGNSNWKDQLTSYNGTTITYDASGNPLKWRNASAMNWTGRQLDSMTLTNGTTLSFLYNSDGLRVSKTVGSETVQYRWNGTTLLAEEHDDYTITFLYDDDTLIGFNYGGNNYFYGIDNLGVIHYVYNEAGTVVVTYTYDAWGNTISASGNSTIISVNPIRYKSYYFDSETGLFYLQSRYYDPVVGRFVNADECTYLGVGENALSFNLYAYCLNNPVNISDMAGDIPVWAVYAVAGAALFGGVTYVIGKALGIKGKALAALTVSLASVGATAAAVLGVKFLAKISPKLANWANKVAKNTKVLKPSYKHKTSEQTSLGGFILFDAFKVMLHPPHHNEHNYFHIQIEFKIPGIKRPWKKFRIKIEPAKWVD